MVKNFHSMVKLLGWYRAASIITIRHTNFVLNLDLQNIGNILKVHGICILYVVATKDIEKGLAEAIGEKNPNKKRSQRQNQSCSFFFRYRVA